MVATIGNDHYNDRCASCLPCPPDLLQTSPALIFDGGREELGLQIVTVD
jgi:hypothetical protein